VNGPDPALVRARLDDVVQALKQASLWDVAEPPPSALAAGGAFGGDAMSFEQWLRWVFVPSVETRLGEGGSWPESSAIAVRAAREWDGQPGLDPLAEALRAFDALFERDPAVLLRRAEALFGEGRWDEAIAAADAAARVDEKHPNALNYAGWLRTRKPSFTEADATLALGYFARAADLEPSKPAPAANYGDLLLRLGREEEAFAWMEARANVPASGAVSHNWLGYWRMQRAAFDDAVSHFTAAVKLRPTWGLARRNLGEALERARRSDEAWEVLDPARHAFDDDAQRAFAHERRGAFAARKGWLRTALREMRRAVVSRERTPGATGDVIDAERWLAARLHAEGVFVPSFALERRWIAARPDAPDTRRVTRATLEAALPTASGEAQVALEALVALVRGEATSSTELSPTLLEAVLGRAPTDPSAAAIALGERWLAAHWERRARAELPVEGTLVDEDGAPLPALVREAELRARASDFAGAAELLERATTHVLEARTLAERAGDAADDAGEFASANRLWSIALRGARQHASHATSGGEGMERMLDVERLERKLGP
jgi:uncharacterized protein YqcC (DUF446 family)